MGVAEISSDGDGDGDGGGWMVMPRTKAEPAVASAPGGRIVQRTAGDFSHEWVTFVRLPAPQEMRQVEFRFARS